MLRKTMSMVSFLAFFVLLLVSFKTVMAEVTADSEAVRGRIEAYQATWNTHDASALSDFFTVDADMIMGNGPVLNGRNAISGWWQNYFTVQEPERTLTIEIESTREITADVVLVDVRTTTGGQTDQGIQLPSRRFRGTWVMVRQSREWFISAMRGIPTEHDRIVRASDQEQLEKNKAMARRWFDEVVNQRNLDAISDIYSPDYIHHGTGGTEIRGIKAARKFAESILAASDDRHAVVEQQVVEDNLVVTRFTSSGHHTGSFRGVEATGKTWITEGIVISRIKDGKIAEDWEIVQQSGL